MTSSQIRGSQTPSPPPSSLPLDDVIFYQTPFPKMIFGKIVFCGKILKLQNQDLVMNISQNKVYSILKLDESV